jgi:hypothetical protein
MFPVFLTTWSSVSINVFKRLIVEVEKDNGLPDILSTCKKCLKIKVRNPAGFFGNGRDRRFADQNGGLWNGKKCPNCVRDHMKNHMKAKRNKDIQ